MEQEFAVSVQVSGVADYFNGQISLDHYSHLLELKDGEIYQDGERMKVCNMKIELPFSSVGELLQQANEKLRVFQLEAIKKKETELAAMKAAFEQEETQAA